MRKNTISIPVLFIVLLFFVSLIYSCSLFDTQKPTITIISHSDGDSETASSPFLLSGTASDNDTLTSVQYRIDSGEFSDVEGLEEWNILVTISSTGTHYITVKAEDGNENIAYEYLNLEVN